MVANPTVLRPTYAPTRLTLATGETSPKAVGANGTVVFIAPGAGAVSKVIKIDTSVAFAETLSADLGMGVVGSILMLNGQAVPAMLVANTATPGVIKKIRQSDLGVIGLSLIHI